MGAAGVSLWKALAGATSCGCFGDVQVNPWYALALDLGATGALLLRPPSVGQPPRPVHVSRRRDFFSGGMLVAAGLLGGWLLSDPQPAQISPTGAIVGKSRLVLLKPEQWTGDHFPLLPHIDIGRRLAAGRWIIVLYRADCPQCHQVIPEYQRLARTLRREPDTPCVAFVQIGRTAGAPSVSPHPAWSLGRLDNTHDWHVTTPTVLSLEEGTVVRVREGAEVGSSSVFRDAL